MQNVKAEKTAVHKKDPPKITRPEPMKIVLSAAAGFLLTGVSVGGALSPFAISFTAAACPLCSLAALGGSVFSAAIGKGLWKSAAELAAMSVSVLYRFIFGKKFSSKVSSAVAAILYFVSSCAFNAGEDWVMFAAIFIRSILCFGAALCFSETAEMLRCGFCGREREKAERQSAAMAASYIIFIAALCSYSLWVLNAGRIAAGFFCCAAGRKFGMKGGAAAGILSGAGFLLSDPTLSRCGIMLALAALIAGHYQPKGKHSVNTSYILSAFAVTAAAGMPSGTPEFIADTSAAAILYCLVPERLYMPKLNGIFMKERENRDYFSQKLEFAGMLLEDVGNDITNASEILRKLSENRGVSIIDSVKSSVCRSVCSQHDCTAAGSCGGSAVLEGCFRAAQAITEREGKITGKKLPTGFEGCTKKEKLAESYNKAFGIMRLQARRDAFSRRFLESTAEQLSASCRMICSLSEETDRRKGTDDELSRTAADIFAEEGINAHIVTVSFDEDMHPFCEAYFSEKKKFSDVMLKAVTEKLSAMLGTELEKPVIISTGSKNAADEAIFRARWWGGSEFYADCHIGTAAAEGAVCGDSSTYFYDGLGGIYIILADGMGKGGRAAAESSMAVSILRRLILAGTGTEGAVKMLNVLLGAASSDETFTTADIMRIDLFTGIARLMKLGAAPTFVYSRNEDGNYQHDEYDDCSAPLGIIGKADTGEMSFLLDESSRIVMMTDGISGEYGEYVRSVMENERLTAPQIAERIVDHAEEDELRSTEGRRKRDDKTAAAIRLYRCGA